MAAPRVLVTGGDGYVGRKTVAALANAMTEGRIAKVVAVDVREVPVERRLSSVVYRKGDVRDPALGALFKEEGVDVVIHLASIVTPGRGTSAGFEYQVDVLGTRNVLEACVAAGARRILVSSSGAAYGYHKDNPDWLTEDDPIRGNDAFTYARNKRLVEDMLGEWRKTHPELEQVVLRIGTIVGREARNQITELFERPKLLAVAGSSSPFVFIWDEDVAGALLHGATGGKPGIYNLAGDGALTVREIATRLGKAVDEKPAWLIRLALWFLKALGKSDHGPDGVLFLQYRPVLANRRLKEAFGYIPKKTSAEAFEELASRITGS
ncbi:MAG: SDR family oxidoreductase [Alphaproteobacteria bacterium]|nr:SDR family oxidoreductase [Alphaproteobacteria bacterium]